MVVLFLTCVSSAWGQTFEAWFNGGQSLLSNSGLGSDHPASFGGTNSDYALEDGFRFSFRMAFNSSEHRFGHEVQYAYTRTKFDSFGTFTPSPPQGMAVHQGGYNFLYYATQEGTRIRPFVTAGVLFANYVPPGSSATGGGGETKFGFSYGGGVKIKVTSLFGLRIDVRQATTPKPFQDQIPFPAGGWIRLTEVSAGVGVQF